MEANFGLGGRALKALRIALIGVLAIIILVACGKGTDSDSNDVKEPVYSMAEGVILSSEDEVILRPVWSGLSRPVGLAAAPGIEDKLYVIEQAGRILELDFVRGKQSIILDLTDRVYSEGSEQGLLGLAFHPRLADEPYLYVNYTTKRETKISRFAFADGIGQPKSEHVLLAYEQPYANHNGGQLAFGPDGYLYIASGDGGSGGDPNHFAQNMDSLLGKILRLDVDAEEPQPEIYAYGLRNPWRFSFDPVTGQLWAADVGQNKLEEINLIEQGGNYGWRLKEGTKCFNPATNCDTGHLIDPIWEYPHSEGQSITGGYVYRGSISSLQGWYIYGDFVSGKVWMLKQDDDGRVDNRLLFESGLPIASFGIDVAHELYVAAYDGSIFTMERYGDSPSNLRTSSSIR